MINQMYNTIQQYFSKLIVHILKKPLNTRKSQELDMLFNIISNIDFFTKIYQETNSDQILIECCKIMEHEYFLPSQIIFNLGTQGDKFYIILSGQVSIFTPTINYEPPQKKQVRSKTMQQIDLKQFSRAKILISGDSFGELALINNRPRLATIISDTDSHMAIIRKGDYSQILKKVEENKIMREMGFFASLPIFKGWNFNLTRFLYLNSFVFTYRMNEIIFREKSIVNCIYIIKSGDFELVKKISKHKNEDLDNNLQRMNKSFQNESGIERKITNLGKSQIICLETIEENISYHQYSCICSSAMGELIFISKKDFFEKIYVNSKEYIDQQRDVLKNYLNQRVSTIQKSIYMLNSLENSQRSYFVGIKNNQNSTFIHMKSKQPDLELSKEFFLNSYLKLLNQKEEQAKLLVKPKYPVYRSLYDILYKNKFAKVTKRQIKTENNTPERQRITNNQNRFRSMTQSNSVEVTKIKMTENFSLNKMKDINSTTFYQKQYKKNQRTNQTEISQSLICIRKRIHDQRVSSNYQQNRKLCFEHQKQFSQPKIVQMVDVGINKSERIEQQIEENSFNFI